MAVMLCETDSREFPIARDLANGDASDSMESDAIHSLRFSMSPPTLSR